MLRIPLNSLVIRFKKPTERASSSLSGWRLSSTLPRESIHRRLINSHLFTSFVIQKEKRVFTLNTNHISQLGKRKLRIVQSGSWRKTKLCSDCLVWYILAINTMNEPLNQEHHLSVSGLYLRSLFFVERLMTANVQFTLLWNTINVRRSYVKCKFRKLRYLKLTLNLFNIHTSNVSALPCSVLF